MSTWKTQIWEKPRQPTNCKKKSHYERIAEMGHTDNDLLLPFFTTSGYNRGNDLFLSLSLSLYKVTLYINLLHTKLALSHIYTHMTFGLFTHIAPRGSLEHIHICIPSNRSGRLPPGLQSSGSSHFPFGGTCFSTFF